ncbi:MAG TPA: type-F conjugative transfer system secretin TraK [Alphaproteobacteria bacterium]|nr:type-F conjugative transfer system secretin TraK [Alphaproteobacteria bacterium]
MILKTFVCLLMGTAAHAAIVRPLDEMKVIEVSISQQGLTRIKVENDRILHVFGIAGEYVLETDTDQGQVFIRPLTLDGSHRISLTLTTEAGRTQDLRLIPSHQAPEALILKNDTEIKQELERDSLNEEKRTHAPLFREEVENLICACQDGRIPMGYTEVPLNLNTLQEPYLLIRDIQGQKLRGLTYRVQNNTKETQVLSEEEFARRSFSEGGTLKSKEIVALLISQKTLKPGEGTDVYVAARAN